MAQFHIKSLGEIITVGARGTGSFTPVAITKTPYVAFQVVKLTDKNSVDGMRIHTTNVRMDYQENGIPWPSGSSNEYLWAVEPDLTAAAGFSGSFSSSLGSAPFTTGSAPGSYMYHSTGLNARYMRLTLESKSGGQFAFITFGKGGD